MQLQQLIHMMLVMHLALSSVAQEQSSGTLHLRVCPSEAAEQGSNAFGSIEEAQTVSRAAIAAGHLGPLVVELCNGRHSVTKVLEFGPQDIAPGGTTYRGELNGNSRAYLDAGVRVTNWTVNAKLNHAWSAPLPPGIAQSRQLWVNGKRAARSHSNPSFCSGGPAQPGSSHLCNRTLSGGTLSNGTGYVGVPATISALSSKPLADWLPGTEFVYGKGASGASWTEPRCSVHSVVPGVATGTVNIVMQQPCWAFAQKPAIKGQGVKYPSDIENSIELLSEPGEWFADWADNKIYYLPRPGESPASVDAVLGSVPSGGVGSAIHVAARTSDLNFENLGFAHQTWLEPSGPLGFVDLQSGFWQTGLTHSTSSGWSDIVGVPGVVALHGVKGVAVKNCTFEHLGLTGVLADAGSQGVNVTDSTFIDTSGSAISIGNVTEAILTPATQDSDFRISNNFIRDTGAEYHGCAGIVAGYVVRAAIEHNDIANTSNGAICLGWGWGAKNTMHSNKVNYNKITRSNTELFDCGSIYTLSMQPGSEVAYNYIQNQVLLFGSLYHDAKSGGFHTHHNVVVGGPMWIYLQWGTMGPVHDIIVEDNWHDQTVEGGCAMPQHRGTCSENLTIANNVLVPKGSTWPAAAKAVEANAGILG